VDTVVDNDHPFQTSFEKQEESSSSSDHLDELGVRLILM